MQLKITFTTIVFLLVALLGYFFIGFEDAAELNIPQKTVTIRYNIELKNTSNKAVKNADVSVFAPKSTLFQKLVSISAVPEVQKGSAEDILHFQFPLIAPFAQKSISITSQVSVPAEPFKTSSVDEKRYQEDGEFLKLDSKELLKALKEFEGLAEEQKPGAIYQWVKNNIQYAGYIQEDRGAEYALKLKKGDCTEYMYLLMAMLRASEIPARGFAGFHLKRNEQIVKASDYHNWVEYYDGSHWRILDPLNDNFDAGYGSYVVLREISGKREEGAMSSQRFAAYDARLAIGMK